MKVTQVQLSETVSKNSRPSSVGKEKVLQNGLF